MWVSHELQNTLNAHCNPQHPLHAVWSVHSNKDTPAKEQNGFHSFTQKILIGPLLCLRHCARPWGGSGQAELAAFGMALIRGKNEGQENGT